LVLCKELDRLDLTVVANHEGVRSEYHMRIPTVPTIKFRKTVGRGNMRKSKVHKKGKKRYERGNNSTGGNGSNETVGRGILDQK